MPQMELGKQKLAARITSDGAKRIRRPGQARKQEFRKSL
jgi:hypothetical protein